MRYRRTMGVATGLAAAVVLGLGMQAAVAQPNQPSEFDFDGDGNPDLVLPASVAPVADHPEAGALGVSYGTDSDPDKGDTQLLAEGRKPGEGNRIPGSNSEGDRFGLGYASGDFDGDGRADLAVCTEPENGEDAEATGLTLVFGGDRGLNESIAVDLGRQDFELYGPCQDVEAIDVNRDQTSDLVISGEDSLSVARGGESARDANGWDFEVLDDDVDAGREGHFDAIGSGDVNGDDFPDLAYAVVGCESCDAPEVGYRVKVGGPEGFSDAEPLRPGNSYEGFARSGLPTPVFGDLNDDGYDEIALGHPGATVDDELDAGKVDVWYGAERGPNEQPDQTITQSTSGVPGTSEEKDEFGRSVAAGDVDGDGIDDLAVGVPFESTSKVEDAGRTVLVPGSPDGPDTDSSRGINQDSPGIPGSLEENDQFGYQVDIAPIPGKDDLGLLVGSPGENEEQGRVYAIGTADSWWFAPTDIGLDTPEAVRFGR